MHAVAAVLHVLGEQHRAAETVVGEQRGTDRSDHQCPGCDRQQPAVADYLRLQQDARRLLCMAETEADDHQQRRHFQQQAGTRDPGVDADVEDAQQVAEGNDRQGHGLRIEVGAEGGVQVSRRAGGEHRRDEQQHRQHREEGGVAGQAAEHPLGVDILAAGGAVRPAQLGIAPGEHQRQHPGQGEGPESAGAGLLDGERGDDEDGTGGSDRGNGDGDHVEHAQGGFQRTFGRGGRAHVVVL